MDKEPTYEDLKKRIARLEKIIGNIGTAMTVFDESGRLLEISKCAAAYLGGEPEELIGRKIWEFFPDNNEEYMRHIREVYISQKSASHKVQFIVESVPRWFLIKYVPLFDDDNNVSAVQVIAFDIDNIIKAELALRESEEIFNCFMEHNPIYVFFKDENIRSIRLSRNYEKMLGMPLEDILGKTMDEIFPSDLAKSMIEDDKSVFREGKQITVVEELNGRFYETLKFPITVEGKPKYLAGYTMDITEQKRTKTKLEGNLAFLKTLMDTIPSPIYYMDKDLRVLGGNRTWADVVIGMKIEDIVGQNICDVYKKTRKDILNEHNRIDKELLEKGGVQVLESRIKCSDDRERDFIFYKSTFPDAEGKIAGFVGVMLDISDRKRAEEENKVLQQRLLQAQKMESIGTLAGGIAHDFNNILMPIIGFSDLIKMKLHDDSPIRTDVYQIRKAADRARDLVGQILTFARQKETERVPLKVAPILKETLKLLRSSVPSTIVINYDIDVEDDTVLADPTQINQIIMNLCTNAVHAMEDNGGYLAVILRNEDVDEKSAMTFPDMEPGRYVKLTFRDTGHGIPPEIREKIFDPYFTTKKPGKGTGLGLSIVHGIVKKHGGDITVESKAREGSSFNVYLPVFEVAGGAAKADDVSRPVPTGVERILVVDDEKASLDVMTSTLEWLGYKVSGRTSSIEALEAFRHNPQGFDLVITDQTMPNMTGKDLSKELMAIRPDIPVILCTGFSEKIDEKTARDLGIGAFVMKPLVMEQIANTIRDVLDRRSSSR